MCYFNLFFRSCLNVVGDPGLSEGDDNDMVAEAEDPNSPKISVRSKMIEQIRVLFYGMGKTKEK